MQKSLRSCAAGIRSYSFLLLAIVLFFGATSPSQSQAFQWATGFDFSPWLGAGNALQTDSAGNTYYGGAFEDNLQIGGTSVSSPGLNLYVVKLNPGGSVVWTQHFPFTAFNYTSINAIEVDAAGNVYVGGVFDEQLNIGTTQLLTQTPSFIDFFVAKLSPTGNVIWAQQGDGDGNDDLASMSLDGQGNLYLSGYSDGFNFTFNGTSVSTLGSCYLLKTNGSGQVLWNHTNAAGLLKVDVSPSGSGFVTGSFANGTLSLGNGVQVPYYNGSSSTAFVAGFNAAGQFQWGQPINGPMILPSSLAADDSGNLVAVGSFTDSVAYGGSALGGSTNPDDLYMLKVNAAGSLLWIKRIGNLGLNMSTFGLGTGPLVEVDNDGNAIVGNMHFGTVLLNDSVYYDPLADTTMDLTLAKYDLNGDLLWHQHVSGMGDEFITGLSIDAAGQINISGGFGDNNGGAYSASFGPNISLSTPTGSAAFVARILNASNMVAGRVFLDLNSSGTQDPGEKGLAGMAVSVQPGQLPVYTQSGGQYKAFTEAGSFQVSLPQPPNYYTLTPAQHTVNFTGIGQADTINHFALQPLANNQDVKVSLLELTPPRPGFNYRIKIIYRNVGTTVVSGNVKAMADTLLSLLSATPAVTSTSGDTLIWAYSNLQPFETRELLVELQVPVGTALGTLTGISALIEPVVLDQAPSDNRDMLQSEVSGSFDPNDKLVSHEAITPAQVTAREPLAYTIRFQNTGTDTAFTVSVRDQLSPLLDMSTLEVLSVSHPYTLQADGPTGLLWKFNNILLPDSNRNEPASHGYIHYRIKPFANLTVGQHILTSANLYFDFNQPVATNITNTAVQGTLAVAAQMGTTPLELWPNPTTGKTVIQFTSKAGRQRLQVLNSVGQTVLNKVWNGKAGPASLEMDLQHLPSGIYLVQLEQAGQRLVERLVLQR